MSVPSVLAMAWAVLVLAVMQPWARAARDLPPSPPAAPAARRRSTLAPSTWRRRLDRRRVPGEVVAELPEVIDLLVLAVGAGCNVALAVRCVAPRSPPHLAGALDEALDRVARGERLADALSHVPERLGDSVRPLVAALVAAERYGVALLPTLERLAVEARAARRRRAEVAARRVPVLLLFPLVLCVLPAFCLLTLVPLLATTLGSLGLH